MNDTTSRYDTTVLTHHGVKGMKWGVRRYQRFDGSYTQKGLERYKKSEASYDKAQQRYKDTKRAQKAGTKSKGDVTNARIARNTAKRQLEKDYKHLKQDKLGDQGKELYSKGVRIRANNRTRQTVAVATLLGAYAANRVLQDSGKQVVVKNYSFPISEFAPATIAAGGTLAYSILSAKDRHQNRRLREYYGHTSNY